MEDPNKLISLECGHKFHICCIELYITQNNRIKQCVTCHRSIDFTNKESLLYAKTPRIIKIQYYLLMAFLIIYTNAKHCFYYTDPCKNFRLFTNFLCYLLLFIMSSLANIQILWATTLPLGELLLLQQILLAILNDEYNGRISREIYRSELWRKAIVHSQVYFIVPQSLLMINTIVIIAFCSLSVYLLIFRAHIDITHVIYIAAILFKLFFDAVVEGMLIQLLFFMIMILYDLIILLPTICYYVITKTLLAQELFLLCH